MSKPIPIPALRAGQFYESLETNEVRSHRDGTPLALVSQVNAGLVRRDLRKQERSPDPFADLSVVEMIDVCRRAGELFMQAELPLNDQGDRQGPEQYVETLSATSGLPHVLCRRNMDKIHSVFAEMPRILKGLTRGLDLSVLEAGIGEQDGVPVSYVPQTNSLGIVLPSNSPGVNSLWIPALALKIPVVLKPGREEPWTPLRIMQAFIEAGAPREAFSYYPTDHEGAASILEQCGRGLIFGDAKTTAQYAQNPGIEIHGPGWSKVLVGSDEIERWRDHLDVLADSVAANGGRSCVNASAIIVPAHGDEIAEALAERLARIEARPAADPEAQLSAFANPKVAEWIDSTIDAGLAQGGAEDLTARFRTGPRRVEVEGSTYLLPTVVRCQRFDHPLANTEFLFPYVSVVELPEDEWIETLGPSLVVSAITKNTVLQSRLLRSPEIHRLNLGPVPTGHVEWDQPHEGNLFEFLYARRAIQRAAQW